MNAARVVHLTSSHSADDPRVFWKECRSLSAAGYDVSLVVPDPGADRCVDGVNIIVVRPPAGRAARLLLAPLRVARAAWRLRADIYHFHDPELLPVALALRATGRAVIYDSHEDLVRKISGRRWIPRSIRTVAARVLGRMERSIAGRFDAVISAEPAAADRFGRSDVAVVENYALESELDGRVRQPSPTVAYVGSVSEDRGAITMARAAERLARPDVEIVVGGPIGPHLAARMLDAAGRGRLTLPGRLDRPAVGALLDRASVGLLLLQPIRQYVEATQPVKLFEYLGAGVPVVASDFPAIRSIVGRSDAGLLVDPTDVAAVVDAIIWLLDHPDRAVEMGERGRAAVRRHYTWRSQAEVLGSVYGRLVG